MYESTDLQGNAIPVTGLYAVPDTPRPAGGFPLVSFAHGTTGVGRMCGISHTPFQVRTPGFSAWTPHMLPMVEAGWAVVATDYSGMGAPGPSSYLVGPLEGRGNPGCPSERCRHLRRTSDPFPSTAASWASTASPRRRSRPVSATAGTGLRPELDLGGGGRARARAHPALQGVLNTVARNPTSTAQNMFVLLIAKSYAENYPELVSLDDILSPAGKQKIELLNTQCGSRLADAVSDVPLSQLINSPVAPGLVTALAEGMPEPGRSRLR